MIGPAGADDVVFNEAFFRFLASLGVGGVIAGLMFFFYRKDVQHYTDQWKGQSDVLLTVVKENTKAITENTQITRETREWIARLDR